MIINEELNKKYLHFKNIFEETCENHSCTEDCPLRQYYPYCDSFSFYEQGRKDERYENEQDAYHRGYLDGKATCSFDNEQKIRADERERIIER